MRFAARAYLVLSLLALLTACAASRGPAGSESGPRARSDLITAEEIQLRSFSNVYDLVESLRPRWMQTRGPDSFSHPMQVQVHMDGARLGGVGAMRSIPPKGIAYIRYFDGIEASSRWGFDHGQGAIYISSRPLGK